MVAIIVPVGILMYLVSAWWNTGKSCYDGQQQCANPARRVQLARHPSENAARKNSAKQHIGRVTAPSFQSYMQSRL